jgi:pilus assembly protein Flp/PilA
MRFLKAFSSDTGGATAVEYGLLAALISVALLIGLTAMSDSLLGVFSALRERLVID